MAILINVDYMTASTYAQYGLSTKYNNKKHKVYMKLTCDDFSLDNALKLARTSKSILMVNYVGLTTNETYLSLNDSVGAYVTKVYEMGNNIVSEDVRLIDAETPGGVTPIIRLPEDFTDLELLWKLSKQYPRVRFCGGDLFCIEGIKLGCIGLDILDKYDIKYGVECYHMKDSLDVLETVDISSIELDLSTRTERVTKQSNKSDSSSPKKTKTLMFSEIFSKSASVLP